MSLLKALNDQRKILKTTETVITHTDGRRFLETANNLQEITTTKYGFVIDTKPDNIPALVINNIYLGSQDCCELSILKKYNIKHVLSVGVDSFFKYDDVNYKFIDCFDLPEVNIVEILNNCLEFIKNAVNKFQNILIHCNAGVSRSSAIVIGYLMVENNLDYNVAYDLIKQVRPCIKPNIGFEKQLQSLHE